MRAGRGGLVDEPRFSRIGDLIGSIGEAAFPDRLVDLASSEVESSAAMILLYRRAQAPLVVLDRLVPEERPYLYGDYLSGVYRLSPFYAAAERCVAPSVRTLTDVAPEGFRHSEYHHLYFSRIGVSDLMAVLVPLPGKGVLHLSLSRATGEARFSARDRGRLELLLPVIASACCQHWRSEPTGPFVSLDGTKGAALASSLPELTTREADVVRAMLSGHSAKSIARTLRISVETVRVHRKHIYAKLGARSQAELFSLYLARLGGGSA